MATRDDTAALDEWLIDEDPEYEARRQQRLAKAAARRAAIADEMRDRGYYNDASRYETCGLPGLGMVEYCPECEQNTRTRGFYKRYVPYRCMSRVCPRCGPYLASGVLDRYLPLIRALMARPIPHSWRAPWDSGDLPDFGLKLVTLTRTVALGGDHTDSTVSDTLDAARELVKRMGWHSDEMGALASLEVGEHGLRFHVHLLVYGPFRWKSAVSERTYQAKNGLPLRSSGGPYLSETWEELTGDYIVDVKPVKDEAAARYALKYVVKGIDNLSPSQAVELHVALKGTRRVRAWGVFYGKAAQAVLAEAADEEEHTADGACRCPKCGARTLWLPRSWFDEMLERHPRIIDLINTNKSLMRDADIGPPRQVFNDPRRGRDGKWRDDSWDFDVI